MTPRRRDPASRPQLILVDDHRLVVEGMRTLLDRHFRVVAVAYSGDQLLSLLRTRTADCLLLDLDMPGRNGLELVPLVRRMQPQLRILAVTMHVDRVLVEAALSAGAHGFVPKDADSGELRRAIATVLAGRRYVSPRVPARSHRLSLDARHRGLQRLTIRQQQILLMMGEGTTAKEVAEALHVRPSTITFHKHNIMRLLGIETEGGLVRHAVLLRAAVGEVSPTATT
jgi:DNA-binding NarL/FixJ family response regulator